MMILINYLQDSSLIDIDYIQYFAKNLGYNVNINRNDIAGTDFGNLSTTETDNSCSAIDQDRYLRFVVEKNGQVSNVSVVKGLSPECDKAAVKVVRDMPNWKPGKNGGRAVRQWCTLPINFTLN
jgi:TonB family protein